MKSVWVARIDTGLRPVRKIAVLVVPVCRLLQGRVSWCRGYGAVLRAGLARGIGGWLLGVGGGNALGICLLSSGNLSMLATGCPWAVTLPLWWVVIIVTLALTLLVVLIGLLVVLTCRKNP